METFQPMAGKFPEIGWKVSSHWLKTFPTLAEKKSFQTMSENLSDIPLRHCLKTF